MIDYSNEMHVPVWSVVGEHFVVMKNGMFAYVNTLYNILAVSLVYYLLKYPDSSLNKILKFKMFMSWGKIVYGIYVYHMVFVTIAYIIYELVLIKYIPIFFSEILAIAICYSLTYYFSKLSFYKFEMYFLMLKAKRDK